jgi:hypothetical protein
MQAVTTAPVCRVRLGEVECAAARTAGRSDRGEEPCHPPSQVACYWTKRWTSWRAGAVRLVPAPARPVAVQPAAALLASTGGHVEQLQALALLARDALEAGDGEVDE